MALLKLTYFVGVSPIYYEGYKYRISQLGLFKCLVSLVFLQVYILIIFPTNVYDLVKHGNFQDAIFTMVVCLGFLVGQVILSTQVYHYDDICKFWNGYANFIKQTEGNYHFFSNYKKYIISLSGIIFYPSKS